MLMIEPAFSLTREGDFIVLRSHCRSMTWLGLVFLAIGGSGLTGIVSNAPGFMFLLLFGVAGAFLAVPREFVTIFDPADKRLVRSIVYFNGAFQQRTFCDFAQIASIGTDEYASREGGFSYLPVLRTRGGRTFWLAPLNASYVFIDPVLTALEDETGLSIEHRRRSWLSVVSG